MDDDQVALGGVEAYRPVSSPRQQSVRRAQQPAVQVADKQDTLPGRRKAPGQFFRRIGRAVEVPQVFNRVRVEPGFDVRERLPRGGRVPRGPAPGLPPTMEERTPRPEHDTRSEIGCPLLAG